MQKEKKQKKNKNNKKQKTKTKLRCLDSSGYDTPKTVESLEIYCSRFSQ